MRRHGRWFQFSEIWSKCVGCGFLWVYPIVHSTSWICWSAFCRNWDFFKLCFCKYFLASHFFSSSSVTLMKWMLYLFIFSQISEALDHFLKIHLLLWGWQASLVWSHGNRKGERADSCAQLHFNTMLVTHMFTFHQWKQVTWLNSSNVRTIHPIHSGRLPASYGKTSLIYEGIKNGPSDTTHTVGNMVFYPLMF